MPQRVRTHFSVQTRTLVSRVDVIFVKDVADSRTRQSLLARVLEERLVELFGTIEVVFLYVIAQKLDRVSHQRYGAHLASLSQKAQLRGWIGPHVANGKIDQLLNARPGVVEDTQQNCISSAIGCSEVWLRQDLTQLFFRKICDGGTSVSPLRDREDFLTLMHVGWLFRLNISEECVQGRKPMVSCLGRRLSFSLQVIQECFHERNVDLFKT